MFTLFLAVLCIYGFLASAIIHVLTFFQLSDPISALILFAAAILLVFPGVFIYPDALPPYDRGFQANYNFWRLIPKKWINILGYVGFYCVAMTLLTAILHQQDDFLPMPYSARMASGMAMGFFFFHSLGYWYHAPLEAKKKLTSLLHLKKKRHRKHS